MAAENIAQQFEEQARKHPHKTAIIYLGRHFSFGRILKWASSFSDSLADLGFKAGDKIMIYMPNGPQWAIAWLGILRLGATAVPVSPIYTPHDLAYMANDSGATGIVCADTNCGYVAQILPETNLKQVIYSNAADLLPAWKRGLGRLLDVVPRGRVGAASFAVPFKRLLSRRPVPSSKSGAGRNTLAEILYTGGTTRRPKGVPITHGLFLASVTPTLSRADPVIRPGENVILQGAPLFHILGQIMGMGALCVRGDSMIPLPRMNLDGMLNTIQRDKVKTLFGVPAMFRMILDHDRLDLYDLSSLRYCLSGGDALPIETHSRWKKRFGLPIGRGYGATETVGGIAVTPLDRDCPDGSYGPILEHKVSRVVAPETLEEAPPNTPGELILSSDPMVTEYWNKPEETREAFIEMEGRVWYRTGDVVTRDENGNIFFLERTADLIKHKGYRIAASEVESVLLDHPAVLECCVVGIPDPKLGQRIKAFVVCREDVKGMTGTDMIRWCRERLVSYKVPQYIEFRDMLPKSKVGKLLRREVRSDEQKRLEKSKWEASLAD